MIDVAIAIEGVRVLGAKQAAAEHCDARIGFGGGKQSLKPIMMGKGIRIQ
jgi:hypothetical protein